MIVPLLVLQALKPGHAIPGSRPSTSFSLSRRRRSAARRRRRSRALWFWFFRAHRYRAARHRAVFPARSRQRAIDRAVAWVIERLNGEDGLGAIFPAMANSVMMFDALGYPTRIRSAHRARINREAPRGARDEAYCQPCVSPIWDTALTCHALLEVGGASVAGDPRKRFSGSYPSRSSTSEVIGRAAARSPSRRLGLPVRQSALSRCRRHRGRGDGNGSRQRQRRQAIPSAIGGRENGSWECKAQRRLGSIRCGQRVLLSQQHPIRRSRRLARPSDRRRDRALRLHAGADRRESEKASPRCSAASIICAERRWRRGVGTAAGE